MKVPSFVCRCPSATPIIGPAGILSYSFWDCVSSLQEDAAAGGPFQLRANIPILPGTRRCLSATAQLRTSRPLDHAAILGPFGNDGDIQTGRANVPHGRLSQVVLNTSTMGHRCRRGAPHHLTAASPARSVAMAYQLPRLINSSRHSPTHNRAAARAHSHRQAGGLLHLTPSCNIFPQFWLLEHRQHRASRPSAARRACTGET